MTSFSPDPATWTRVGSTGLRLPRIGLGTAHFGGMHGRVPAAQARETLEVAWDGGIRYFDVAPYYGLGLSEHRLGGFLIDKPRAEFVVTTKVGRVLHRPRDLATFDRTPWGGGLNFEIEWNYGYDGVMRAYEQSLLRLGLDTIDALLIHDPDRFGHGEMFEPRMKDIETGGIKALEELKRNGDVKAIGMGLNRTESIEEIGFRVPLDFMIVAMPYTLLDQSALHAGLDRCAEEGISVVIGTPFASGILVTGPGPRARYRYEPASDDIQEKARRIRDVCAAHGVSLATAALSFPLIHPAVVAAIPGAAHPDEARQLLGFCREDVPAALWPALKSRGLIEPDAPTGPVRI